eukprot:3300989-Prymnesium_polylepis.1
MFVHPFTCACFANVIFLYIERRVTVCGAAAVGRRAQTERARAESRGPRRRSGERRRPAAARVRAGGRRR